MAMNLGQVGASIADEMTLPGFELVRHPRDAWIFPNPYPMSARLVKKLHGLIRAFVPREIQLANVEERIEQQLRRMMCFMQPVIVKAFFATLCVLDWSPVWTGRALRRLHRLSPEESQAILTALAYSRFRPISEMVVAARAVVLALYYDLEEVAEHIGWHPVPFMRERVALRQRLLAGDEAADRDRIGPFSSATHEMKELPTL